MTNSQYFIQSLTIAAFRAYLNPKKFDFSKQRCLAIFAPNGSGKSSIVDALEFMLSKDGTLERLDIRTIHNNAGFVALAHNMAEEVGIEPYVSIDVIQGSEISSGKRLAAGAKRPIPQIAATLKNCFATSPIVRGHALRTFVETHTPE